ncbi:peptidylprolyl isomerase [Pseudomonas alcaligenes]|uniref:Peptidyl-prolyl cis-trans isomerase n=2 Tax=Pseudomonadaceae TaxID=135621 RepID=A0A1V0LZZ5_ECTOL|nr:FKBP-type peptidyl-prolyl cis-trans isomerase [Pseudomonas alcaligenes]ARD68215.1 Peptidil-prolyl cis-trans isomerase [Pseudomonas oleovorans]MBC9252774.1 peptidylprolyl isomerase [Pseudomonas alcaligenes]
MLRFSLLLLCLFSSLSQAAQQDEDLAYSMGVRLGERLRSEMPSLRLEALLDGLRQAYRDEPLRLPPEQIEQLLDAHEAQLAKQAESTRREQASVAEGRFLAREKSQPGVRELAGGVLVRELHAGHGEQPQASSRVRVNYRGELADGSLFDQSEGPQWFRLNALIPGWQTALRAMPVGAKWRVVIPAAQGYGHEGAGDLIPPDAPLVFEVELLDVAR